MLKYFIIVCIVLIAFIALLFVLAVISKSKTPPGLLDGRLSKCPKKPNCVCTEYIDDTAHYIAPIPLPQNNMYETLDILRNLLQDMGGRILSESDIYIAAGFSTSFFAFVDDFELRIDLIQKVIHVRSASRVGRFDAGVNRKRVELFKKLYGEKVHEQKQPQMPTHHSAQ